MNRKSFIKTSVIAGVGISTMPLYSYSWFKEEFSRDQLIGKGNPDIIGKTYTSKMHKDTWVAFQKMKRFAAKDGITIEIVSAYRSFKRQKEIFENKYKRFTTQGLQPLEAVKKIIEYSTIPGTSRHHWGTDIDLIQGGVPKPESLLVANNYHGKGAFCKLKDWLDNHAESFGFFEVYTDNPHRKGFKYEPWHFSYAPTSIPMLKAYIKLDLKSILQEEEVLGSEFFTDAFIEKYRTENILDINPKLL